MEMVEWVKITHYITLALFSILEHFQYLDNEGSHIDTVGHTFFLNHLNHKIVETNQKLLIDQHTFQHSRFSWVLTFVPLCPILIIS